MFQLHAQLAADTVVLGRFPLSLLLLAKDANYPWCILVPQRPDVREIFELSLEDRRQLLAESCTLAETLSQLFSADKINVATIGNMVPQLHMHHVARFVSDAAWPRPIWGAVPIAPYKDNELAERAAALVAALAPAGLVV
ncbi:MAG: HIT domain-containing protein [Porticoccaceae bacterium]|jgi:diadenosine tetraphosphate (Ap4A) HIT family hydrolase|nr:MAG: hypothetical protein ABS23_09325 [SAR92 bacterium BACL16 MAG-120619-bin48]MDO7635360.1 HIT domain-containing protein [Porticoccaceae bacterium]MDP4654383.1 HIT domain-containing protein [Alphaproteobacteria bacterium]MDP4746028.1 HIT domain-containing protein [Porticoccaceae bacterium]MDP4751857.1 HIT domain-containing protein [Porticoccaceae bacterium]|tara:strand:+ start:1163 stop:1582 length:420 start_codon:yes stop_codon:yes gene_type:complete